MITDILLDDVHPTKEGTDTYTRSVVSRLLEESKRNINNFSIEIDYLFQEKTYWLEKAKDHDKNNINYYERSGFGMDCYKLYPEQKLIFLIEKIKWKNKR